MMIVIIDANGDQRQRAHDFFILQGKSLNGFTYYASYGTIGIEGEREEVMTSEAIEVLKQLLGPDLKTVARVIYYAPEPSEHYAWFENMLTFVQTASQDRLLYWAKDQLKELPEEVKIALQARIADWHGDINAKGKARSWAYTRSGISAKTINGQLLKKLST